MGRKNANVKPRKYRAVQLPNGKTGDPPKRKKRAHPGRKRKRLLAH